MVDVAARWSRCHLFAWPDGAAPRRQHARSSRAFSFVLCCPVAFGRRPLRCRGRRRGGTSFARCAVPLHQARKGGGCCVGRCATAPLRPSSNAQALALRGKPGRLRRSSGDSGDSNPPCRCKPRQCWAGRRLACVAVNGDRAGTRRGQRGQMREMRDLPSCTFLIVRGPHCAAAHHGQGGVKMFVPFDSGTAPPADFLWPGVLGGGGFK